MPLFTGRKDVIEKAPHYTSAPFALCPRYSHKTGTKENITRAISILTDRFLSADITSVAILEKNPVRQCADDRVML